MNKQLDFAMKVLLPSLLLTACISAQQMLEWAEDSWREGNYAQAIYNALDSYEKAVEKGKEVEDIENAQAFLEEYFSQANERLSQKASDQLSGSDQDKTVAWKTYQTLVDMNRKIGDSIASDFLEIKSFTRQLQEAKDVAAQVFYVKVLERIAEDNRSSYMEAVAMIDQIQQIAPDYRDIRTLRADSVQAGMLVIAFADTSKLQVRLAGERQNLGQLNITGTIYSKLQRFIVDNDNPEFLRFTKAINPQNAQQSGAEYYIEVTGNMTIKTLRRDSYSSNGTIIWERGYNGTVNIVATRLSDSTRALGTGNINMDQQITIEFYPVKYRTTTITLDLYNNQFNNPGYMQGQLRAAKDVVRGRRKSANMIVWAEMAYGGVANFLPTARLDGAGDDGSTIEGSIDSGVYSATASFINNTLPKFLTFGDFDLSQKIADEAGDAALSEPVLRNMLANF